MKARNPGSSANSRLGSTPDSLPFDFQGYVVLASRQQPEVVALRIKIGLSGALNVDHRLDVAYGSVLFGVQDQALHTPMHLRHEVDQRVPVVQPEVEQPVGVRLAFAADEESDVEETLQREAVVLQRVVDLLSRDQ